MNSREQFENWYLTEYFEGDKNCGLEWLSTEPCGNYRYERPSTQWKIWQAARATLAIKLPRPRSFGRDEDAISAWEARVVVDACTEAGVSIKRD